MKQPPQGLRASQTLCWLLISIALSLSLSLSGGAIAAESEPAATAEAAETNDDNAATTANDKGTEGVFLPSEEISEDFAVSFPVDI